MSVRGFVDRTVAVIIDTVAEFFSRGYARILASVCWFSEAHRLESESQINKHWLVFGGLGYRLFRDMTRTRFEAEQGVVTSWNINSSLHLLGAMSARWQQAHSAGNGLVGGTAISELDWSLSPRTDFRWALSASVDYYPHSDNYFPGSLEERRDLLECSSARFWHTIFCT